MSILNDFDEDKTAIINPEDFIKKREDFPEIAIATFTEHIVDSAFQGREKKVIAYLYADTLPVYRLDYQGTQIAIFTSKTGAPASVAGEEAVIALGARKLIYFGSCGVLDNQIAANEIIIPTHAIRDEGTSYHYLRASEEIALDPDNIALLVRVLDELGISYRKGKTWTTDAIFRETRKKFEKRREQGSIAVEMECSALAAVAQFRGASFTQFLYSADNLDAEQWDPRSLGNGETKEEVYLKIALEYALAIKE
jgi:uridine phosphorylase